MGPTGHAYIEIKRCRKVCAVCSVLCSIAESETADAGVTGAHEELCKLRNVSGIQTLDAHFSHIEELRTLSPDVCEIGCEASGYFDIGAHQPCVTNRIGISPFVPVRTADVQNVVGREIIWLRLLKIGKQNPPHKRVARIDLPVPLTDDLFLVRSIGSAIGHETCIILCLREPLGDIQRHWTEPCRIDAVIHKSGRETRGFNDKTGLDGIGHPHSDALHVTERFPRIDLGHLDIEMTFDDPAMYTKSFTIKIPHTLLADQDIFEMFCENEKDREHLKNAKPQR